jgi:hypothetical protein
MTKKKSQITKFLAILKRKEIFATPKPKKEKRKPCEVSN